jgi:hypothetical protein
LTKPRKRTGGYQGGDWAGKKHVKKLTLFVPDALGCAMPATPPWYTLHLMSLSWWKREVEEMIK